MNFRLSALVLFLFVAVAKASAFQVPALSGPVVDNAHVLNSRDAEDLSNLLRGVADHGKAQIQILTVPSLDGESIEAASIQVVDKWKLGQAHKDNGILIMIAAQDHKVRIEVGQGLEGDLPDVYAHRIIDDVMKPLFRSGRFSAGAEAAVIKILSYVDPEYLKQLQVNGGYTIENNRDHGVSGGDASRVIFFIVLIILFLLSSRSSLLGFLFGFFLGGGGGGWGSGGSGRGSGGSWGGGGGGFSGGGSSGGW